MMIFQRIPTAIDQSTQPVSNLRDVMLLPGLSGDALQGICFRCGDIKVVPDILMQKMKTVINFRVREDNKHGIEASDTFHHIPLLNDLDVYDLSNRITVNWLRLFLCRMLKDVNVRNYPFYFIVLVEKIEQG